MIIHFYLRYSTHFGQSLFVCGNQESMGGNDVAKARPLKYLDKDTWSGTVEMDLTDLVEPIKYFYLVREKEDEITEPPGNRVIDTSVIETVHLSLYDTWNDGGGAQNAYLSSAFCKVLLPDTHRQVLIASFSKELPRFTHEFRVKAPMLGKDELLFIAGAGPGLHEWETTNPILLSRIGDWWVARLERLAGSTPLAYKYGICRKKDTAFLAFEEGDNRILPAGKEENGLVVVEDGFVRLKKDPWRGAGVAVPVFSLCSNKSFGVGEFTDLHILVDWAKLTRLKLIQLLPVHDTTATHTRRDSYPYSAISAFALHPLYINLESVAGMDYEHLVKPLARKRKQLNELPEVDYEQVMRFKLSALRELYQAQKEVFPTGKGFREFFDQNKKWLVPYAAFCFLRDKYGTADFKKWRSHAAFDAQGIHRMVSPSQKHYDDIAIHYFIQYHLHLQLASAARYANSNGIVLKGDIPIGIYPHSVDAWMEPHLFHMEEQAGAPPDAFAVKGQNWGFPTYNWARMQEDHFEWWRKRFAQMNRYFDAFRIDHILGFFRIWSIPAHSVEGIMGRFVPALPIHINELFERRISYDRYRYTRPFITEEILKELFGDQLEEVRPIYFGNGELKEEFNTQRKVEEHFAGLTDPDLRIRQSLFDLISNVILFEEEGSHGQRFHFRINMESTSSFKALDAFNRDQLRALYLDYFYQRQEEMWRKEAMQKLPLLKQSTGMLVCGEDLGMVPHCVPEVMKQLGILSLEIQRMPKKTTEEFFHPHDAPYLSVVSPSTHDMSTIRGWWEEDGAQRQRFYHTILGHTGDAPVYCEAWINKEIVVQHLHSPAMWSIFQLQDIMGISGSLRRENPHEERINLPSDPDHYWNYRMHIKLEDLIKEKGFNEELRAAIEAAGR